MYASLTAGKLSARMRMKSIQKKAMGTMDTYPRYGVYIHIPFCLKRCIYCDFVSGIYSPEKESAYIKALKKEILNIHNEIPFKTLYIGGGTPTVLSSKTLSDLINHIFSNLSFTEGYEATIELNPGTIDSEKLQAIRSSGINPVPQQGCGVNRISIGVQSFNDGELKFLGRLHSSKDAEQAVYLSKEAGFENLGIDLIYGIPGQNIDSWKRTLEKTVNLKPKHISTYELTVEQGTSLYEQIKTNKLKRLEEEKIIEMYEYTIDYLKAEGFVHYEISNFAIPDYFCMHNLNYWDRGEYYGIGLGAHSFINPVRKLWRGFVSNGIKGKRFYNTDNLKDYIKALSEDKSPVKETEDITEDKALSETIFLGLRKTGGINLKNFSETFGRDIVVLFRKEIKELEEAGLIEIGSSRSSRRFALHHTVQGVGTNYHQDTDTYMRLTRKGLLLSNEVFVKFI